MFGAEARSLKDVLQVGCLCVMLGIDLERTWTVGLQMDPAAVKTEHFSELLVYLSSLRRCMSGPISRSSGNSLRYSAVCGVRRTLKPRLSFVVDLKPPPFTRFRLIQHCNTIEIITYGPAFNHLEPQLTVQPPAQHAGFESDRHFLRSPYLNPPRYQSRANPLTLVFRRHREPSEVPVASIAQSGVETKIRGSRELLQYILVDGPVEEGDVSHL